MKQLRPATSRRRGEPAIALGGLMALWVLARGALLAWPGDPAEPMRTVPATLAVAEQASTNPVPLPAPPAPMAEIPVAIPPLTALAVPHRSPPALPLIAPVLRLLPAPLPAPLPAVPPPTVNIRAVAGHQLLYLAAFAELPLPPELLAARPDLAAPPAPSRPQSRWSGDGWLLWRQDSGTLPVGGFAPASYGGSQAGAVLRYRLAPASRHQPLAYLRVSSALANPAQPELAIGFGARPFPRLPLTVLAELRVSESSGRTRVRPAVTAVASLPRQRLPLGFGIEAYGQAGYVAGPDASGFADGQARIDRPIARLGSSEVRGGGAVWGGAQRGAGRFDVGPSASIELKLGPTNARLSADWRFRVAGQAAPPSGPAVTLSAGF